MLEYEEPNVDKKFAMVTFATGARKDFDFLEQAIAKDRIDNVPYPGGGTNTQAGLQMAFDIFSKGTLQIAAIAHLEGLRRKTFF